MLCSILRWLTIRYVAVRILEQWKNLKVYYLQFLLKQSIFRSSVANTDCYKRISEALHDPLTEVYVSFCAYSAAEFEDFCPFSQMNQKWICFILQCANLFPI